MLALHWCLANQLTPYTISRLSAFPRDRSSSFWYRVHSGDRRPIYRDTVKEGCSHANESEVLSIWAEAMAQPSCRHAELCLNSRKPMRQGLANRTHISDSSMMHRRRQSINRLVPGQAASTAQSLVSMPSSQPAVSVASSSKELSRSGCIHTAQPDTLLSGDRRGGGKTRAAARSPCTDLGDIGSLIVLHHIL